MPRRYRSRKRAEAVERTRRRILEATMQLHGKQGILATSWEDIAQRAGVSLATVYRHFPSVNELVPACGELTDAYIQPPTPDDASSLFAGAATLAERIARLVGELSAFYERAEPAFIGVRREAHLLEPLREWLAERDRAHEALVREALRPSDPAESAIQVVQALTGFPVWASLIEAGVRREAVSGIIEDLVLCWLSGTEV
jgi:AcrR family transcriptional regulator